MNEIERIELYKAGEIPVGLHWIYSVRPRGDLNDSLSRIKQIVKIIASQSPQKWPTDERWRSILPDWFVESLKFYTQEEAELLLAITPREKWSEIPWDFQAWLEAIRDKGWQWWSSKAHELEIEICLSIVEWPARLEAFEHIITAAGAEFVSKTYLGEN